MHPKIVELRTASHRDAESNDAMEGNLRSLWEDVYYAIRNLRHRPGFVAACVGTLALATGANIAIFSSLGSGAGFRIQPWKHY